jgi:hypothetical protein
MIGETQMLNVFPKALRLKLLEFTERAATLSLIEAFAPAAGVTDGMV